jgi:hypothetical protein
MVKCLKIEVWHLQKLHIQKLRLQNWHLQNCHLQKWHLTPVADVRAFNSLVANTVPQTALNAESEFWQRKLNRLEEQGRS